MSEDTKQNKTSFLFIGPGKLRPNCWFSPCSHEWVRLKGVDRVTADVMWIFEEWAVSESRNKGGGMEANSKEPVWNMKSMKVCDLWNKCPSLFFQ